MIAFAADKNSVILPVVYFLVLTSIIVHGVTIPVGKGFTFARTLTVTRSTGDPSADLVSRLPPPVAFGDVQPPTKPADTANNSVADLGAIKATDGSDDRVHFDLGGQVGRAVQTTTDSAPISRNVSFTPATKWDDGVMGDSRVTPISSGRTTPEHTAAEHGISSLRNRLPESPV